MMDGPSRVVLITGPSSGIGRELPSCWPAGATGSSAAFVDRNDASARRR